MSEVREGDQAPDFALPSSDGRSLSLHDLQGRNVVLYFYPQDDTPGCTKEACGFRDTYPDLQGADVEVLGVSPDNVKSHERFVEKYNLPFTLLPDVDHKVAEAYGVWKEKSLYGRNYLGIERSTFLIDGNGTIKKVWRKVKADGHAEQVMQALQTTS